MLRRPAALLRRRFSAAAGAAGEATPRRVSPLTWPIVCAVAVVGGGAVFAYRKRVRDAEQEQRNKSAGRAAIGGPMSLVRDDGMPVTDADYRGRFLLLYFGFTFCPDVCPAELRKMATVVDLLEKRGIGADTLQPMFVSLDPNRDTVAQVRYYVRDFHDRLVGFTGTPDQCADAARQYRVYSSRTGDDSADSNDYLVDHSIITYLVDRGGQFSAYYAQTKTAAEIADAVEKEIRAKGL
jgi:protein SCO1